MTEPQTPTPQQLITAADRGSGAGDAIARRTSAGDATFAITLGVLVASFLLAAEFVFPSGNLALILACVAGYSVGVVALVLVNLRRRRATRRGWNRRYGAGFALTMTFYAVGVALSIADQPSGLSFWLPYAVVTALPLAIAALVGGRE